MLMKVNYSSIGTLIFKVKNHALEITFLMIYFLAIFPGRMSNDVEYSIYLMNNNQSSSNWTELYFRFLQIITLNGRTIGFASLLGLIVLSVSFKFFLNSVFINESIKNLIFRLFCVFPLMPIFGLTVQHDVFACSGTLLITGVIQRIIKSKQSASLRDFLTIFFSIFFVSMSYIGLVAAFGFLVVLIIQKKKIQTVVAISSLLAIQTLSLLLAVSPKDPGFKLIPFLGDLKCIAQDSDSKVTKEQWDFLEKLGPREDWISSQTCMSADNAMFAVKNAGNQNLAEFFQIWSGLVSQNSRVFLSARVQRAAMALPPPLFSGQPNSRESNYLIPVGQDSNRSLRTAPEVIIDSPLNGQFRNQQIPLVKYLERPVLSASFLMNLNSKIWGWGGFWILWFILFLAISKKPFLIGSIPIFCQFILLLLLSPMPDPRYVFSWIIMGIASAIYLLVMLFQRIKLSIFNVD